MEGILIERHGVLQGQLPHIILKQERHASTGFVSCGVGVSLDGVGIQLGGGYNLLDVGGVLLNERKHGGAGVGDAPGADVHKDIGRDAERVRALDVLGDLGNLPGHAVHIGKDLIGSLLQPRGLTGILAGGDGVHGDVLALGQDAHQAAFLIATPSNLVGQSVDLVAGGLAFPGVQGLSCQPGGPHLLGGVAIAVANGLDLGEAGLAGHIGTGQVGGVVVDDLRQAGLVVGVVGDGLRAGIGLGSLREQVQGGELRVLDIVGLSLDMVEFPGEKHRGVLGAIKASALGRHDGSRDGGLLQRPHLGTVVVQVLGFSHFRFLLFSYAWA